LPLSFVNIHFANCVLTALKNKLKQTTQKIHYNGWHNRLEHGYHSFHIFNFIVEGQRNPTKRLHKIRNYFDFKGKKVLDLGCNTGGMLFHLNDIHSGVGLDFDNNCIDFCNYLKYKVMFFNSLQFYVKDLNEFNCEEYCNTIKFKPDIIFLLSLGSWVKNWKDLYYSVAKLRTHILLETNNDKEGLPQIAFLIDLGAKVILVSNESDDDITDNVNRRTYLISFSN
jgi:SAM-dependent methyltransferase